MTSVREVVQARPADKRVDAQIYAFGKIKVRLLNNGVVQYATGDSGWVDVEGDRDDE